MLVKGRAPSTYAVLACSTRVRPRRLLAECTWSTAAPARSPRTSTRRAVDRSNAGQHAHPALAQDRSFQLPHPPDQHEHEHEHEQREGRSDDCERPRR